MRRKIKNAARFMVILFVSVTFIKCQKDDNDVGQTDVRIISSAKEWFKAYESNGDNFALLQNLDYNWNEAEIRNSQDGTKTIIVPVNEAKKDATELWEQKLYIYKLADNKYEAMIFEIFPNGASIAPEDLSIDSPTFNGYITAWDLKKGFVRTASFENGQLVENGKVKLILKSAGTTGKAPSDNSCPAGIECDIDGSGTTDTGIQLKDVVVNNNYKNTSSGGYIIYNGMTSGYSIYTDTGSYTNHGTGTGSGSEGGEDQSTNATDPCAQLKALTDVTQTGNMKPSIDWLKGKVMASINRLEHGVEVKKLMNPDETYRYEYNQISSVDEFSVPLSTGSSYIGGAHSHPKNGYAMFSFGDVKFLRNAYSEASPSRKEDVFLIMVAKDKAGNVNTYSIKVNDFVLLDSKVNSVWNNPNLNNKSEKEKLKKIHDEQAELYDGSEGALEESFLKQFGSFGITIYKADPLLTKWSKVELNPTTKKANLVPCT
ncbi:hypothetical protein [Flavobacterium sp. F52]|uniref:hypothetical protein n=1 Tax=Flavobacterium sp. F52 TaxID=1202532 RepID=UPI000272EEDC|nr:hypothetical protein [Flavobacterium sp. F52]EJG03324.1 hypothetical protein FF52_01405 [Flavobacterium sp. F52]